MYPTLLRKENVLPCAVLVFSLFTSIYIVAHGQTAPPQGCVPRPAGLVGWWDGNSVIGTTVKDLAGGRDGTLVSGATIAAGKSGQAFSFDGVYSYVEVPSLESKLTTNQLTIAVWVKPVTYPSSSCCAHIVGLDSPGSWMTHIGIDGNPKKPYLWTKNGIYLHDPSPLLLGEWQHLAATYDGATVKWYRNGVLKAEQRISVSLPIGTTTWIGNSMVEQRPFNGLIDDVEIFNSAKTAAEIMAIFNAGGAGECKVSPPPPLPPAEGKISGLVSMWNGDAVSGKTVSDTKDGNKGTIFGGVTVDSGKVGNAFQFDGSGGRIKVGNPANLNFGTGPFSLEAWFMWDGGGSDVNNVIRKSNYPLSGPGAGYWLRIGKKSKTLEFYVGETTGIEGGRRGVISTPVSPKTWYRVVATKDNSGTMKLYVDGELKGTAKALNADTTSEAPFTLGAWDDRFGVIEFFSGMIGEVSVYNRALDVSEVKFARYPIPELGNCRNKEECRAYCDLEQNFDKCTAFTKEAGTVQTVPPGKQAVLDAIKKGEGPGKCKDEVSCRTYCEDMDHLNECVSFVEKFNLATPDDLKEIRQVAAAEQAGVQFPGGCRTKENCFKYCENPGHAIECVNFAEAAGFISKDEAEQAKKFAPLIVNGETPGKCTTKDKCEAYCSLSDHVEECIAFAEKEGILQGQELEQVKKIAPFLKRGETPGGCKSKDSCETYCGDLAHSEECVSFAEKAGLMSKDEADMVRKAGGKGPGGCNSKDTCEAFCNDRANQQTCMDFAKEHGIDTTQFEQKKAAAMQEFQNCVALSSCSEFMSCMKGLQAKYGGGGGQGQEEQAELPSDVQAKLNTCIAEMQKGVGGGQGGPSGGGGNFPGGQQLPPQQQPPTPGQYPTSSQSPPANYGGPGGCKSPDECQIYCMANPQDPGCNSQQITPQSSPQTPPPSGQIPQEYCSGFASVPSCSYVGAPDSQNYKYCKQCFPDK